jgi:hypothetical protein
MRITRNVKRFQFVGLFHHIDFLESFKLPNGLDLSILLGLYRKLRNYFEIYMLLFTVPLVLTSSQFEKIKENYDILINNNLFKSQIIKAK